MIIDNICDLIETINNVEQDNNQYCGQDHTQINGKCVLNEPHQKKINYDRLKFAKCGVDHNWINGQCISRFDKHNRKQAVKEINKQRKIIQ